MISIVALDEQTVSRAQALAERLNLVLSQPKNETSQLWLSEEKLALKVPAFKKPFFIDFCSGKYLHRRKFGGGRGQVIARAVGLKHGQTPVVIDATAGFARDAFVMASLGCQVTMIEQNSIMSLLLADALQRAANEPTVAEIAGRMRLLEGNAIKLLANTELNADVIYLDPMYPVRNKSALVKKEMQLLHQLVGSDKDSAELLTIARRKALKRVVVKRPKGAGFVGEQKPANSLQSKNTRFDIYPTV